MLLEDVTSHVLSVNAQRETMYIGACRDYDRGFQPATGLVCFDVVAKRQSQGLKYAVR